MDEISKCPGKLIIVTAAAPEGSVYDFCSRFFSPRLGVDEVKNPHHLTSKAQTKHQKLVYNFNIFLFGSMFFSGPCMWKCTLSISTLLEPQDEQV